MTLIRIYTAAEHQRQLWRHHRLFTWDKALHLCSRVMENMLPFVFPSTLCKNNTTSQYINSWLAAASWLSPMNSQLSITVAKLFESFHPIYTSFLHSLWMMISCHSVSTIRSGRRHPTANCVSMRSWEGRHIGPYIVWCHDALCCWDCLLRQEEERSVERLMNCTQDDGVDRMTERTGGQRREDDGTDRMTARTGWQRGQDDSADRMMYCCDSSSLLVFCESSYCIVVRPLPCCIVGRPLEHGCGRVGRLWLI